MDPFVPAYCAGLFDAKGNINVSKESRGFRVQVQLVSTDRSVLERFQAAWDGKIYAQGTPKKNGWAQAWALAWVGGASQERVLTGLKPYLVIKRQQAEIALALLELRQSVGVRIPSELVARRRELAGRFAATTGRHLKDADHDLEASVDMEAG